jgi:hypothetical protein
MSEHKTLADALLGFQGEMPAIEKTKDNPAFKKKYADLASAMEQLRPILAKHGIAHTQIFHVADTTLYLRTRLMAAGETLDSDLPINQPPNPQEFVKVTTYYRRVGLFSALGVTPQDEDDDGNTAAQVVTTRAPAKAPPPKREPLPPLPSPQAEVERALGATVTPIQRPDADTDPWKLASVPAEDVAALIITAIETRPWPEVTAALRVYRDKLTLTDHERELIRKAQAERKQTMLVAAG